MKYRQTIELTVILLVFLASAECLPAQSIKEGPSKLYPLVPSALSMQIEALGKRAGVSGKEKTIYQGELIDESGKASQVRVIVQLPRMVRLEGAKEDGEAIAFDGSRAKNAKTRLDRSLLETFAMDTVEGMLASIQNNAGVRVLGRDFGPDPLKEPNYSGIRYDIYDVIMPNVVRDEKARRLTQFYYDSATGLLHKTVYKDWSTSPATEVETRFSMWGAIEGSSYPASIDRYENGVRIFSFIATSIQSEPAEDSANYR
jgi:hypothetical protein